MLRLNWRATEDGAPQCVACCDANEAVIDQLGASVEKPEPQGPVAEYERNGYTVTVLDVGGARACKHSKDFYHLHPGFKASVAYEGTTFETGVTEDNKLRLSSEKCVVTHESLDGVAKSVRAAYGKNVKADRLLALADPEVLELFTVQHRLQRFALPQ